MTNEEQLLADLRAHVQALATVERALTTLRQCREKTKVVPINQSRRDAA